MLNKTTKQEAIERLDHVRPLSADGVSVVDALQALNAPIIVEPLRSIREAISLIEEIEEDYKRRPHDYEILKGTIASTLDRLKEDEELLKERTAEMYVRVLNCECDECEHVRKVHAAPNN